MNAIFVGNLHETSFQLDQHPVEAKEEISSPTKPAIDSKPSVKVRQPPVEGRISPSFKL